MKTIMRKSLILAMKAKTALSNKKGETSVGTGIAILISVVLGALVLAGLYTLLGDLVLPSLSDKVMELFNYAG
jgi:hypothetical protein